ncbi:MAG: Zn-ribbon domain-containing OB-fold protein [Desulfurococcaceae archaeon]|nr:Zn-ribbon domain-containing OB-fold protein [Sulfolobales archaeon]MDW8170102.1 Zn-ribbon domain-containing OB-fold protein [Desulfurococcaceae archaeon]
MKYSIPRYWRSRRNLYRLEAVKCRSCSKINYPPSTTCRYCGSRDVELFEVNGLAKLITWTAVYSEPEGFEVFKPIVVGVVEFPECGVRVLARITDVDLNELREGLVLEPILRKISEDGEAGIIRYSLAFRPKMKE